MQLFAFFKFLILTSFIFSFSYTIGAQGNDIDKEVMSLFSDSKKDIWIHHYDGLINNVHHVKLGLGFDGTDYKGIYQYQSSGAYFNVEGRINNDILELQEIDNNDITTGYFLLKKEKNKWKGEWKNLDKTLCFPAVFHHEAISNKIKNEDLQTKDKYYEYADFDIRMEWTYPSVNNPSFNKWIMDKILIWKRETKKEIIQLKENSDGITSKDRFFYEALAWTEITCLTDKLVSGKFLIQKNWDPNVMVNTFQFDLEKEEDFDIQSLFKQELQDNATIRNAIDTQLESWSKEENEIISNWLTRDAFHYFMLSNEGLVISTGFSTIFGSKEFVIPFSELKDITKKSSIIKNLNK